MQIILKLHHIDVVDHHFGFHFVNPERIDAPFFLSGMTLRTDKA